MNGSTLILGFLLVWVILYLLFHHFVIKKNTTSKIIGSLLKSFSDRNETVVEFRAIKEKAQARIREFEIKTIRHHYYTVKMKGLEIVSTTSMDQFSIPDDASCYVKGTIDPVNLENYKIEIRVPQNQNS